MDFEQARFNMIEQQIRPWNLFDEELLNLLHSLKREEFAPEQYSNLALSDVEIPLPGSQKMLFPRVEARLLQELKLTKNDKVLEIGTGSGYVTGLLAKLTSFVYSVEVNELNKQFGVTNLTKIGIKNVSVIEKNGINGLADKAPFDKIFIGGGLHLISEELKQQLKIGGRLVGFIGYSPIMHAVLIERIDSSEFRQTQLFETDIDLLTSETTDHFKF